MFWGLEDHAEVPPTKMSQKARFQRMHPSFDNSRQAIMRTYGAVQLAAVGATPRSEELSAASICRT